MDILKYTSDDLGDDELAYLIKHRKSFQVVGVRNITSVVNKLESTIESLGYRCRVYSEYRAALMAGALIPVPVALFAGWGAAIGAAVHNLSTFNPDFEIAKNKLQGTVTVKYKK
ncbi:hypothetical protein [Limnobaculum parvum]|uniref:Uncharacterized protein n=1 Tax=Limnobaculum parvum TaxID=2172103 RepID=A0A2Y9TWF1_9GAMM|nr:hypothetical protein [Limnobaculum parvum]AWH87901.1 hypothetical protein HYN51_04600 [Limnobaculum parvum]